MHIIIGLITALAGLFWALNSLERSGFRLSSLNPFYWHRRRQWRKKYSENPLYTLDNPMDAAAAILLGIAKIEGEISREHKNEILDIFSSEFNLDAMKAKELFASTSYLLQSENNFVKNIGKVLSRSIDQFSTEQAESTISLAMRIAKIENEISPLQQDLLDSLNQLFKVKKTNNGKW